jgi:hypothetical protein
MCREAGMESVLQLRAVDLLVIGVSIVLPISRLMLIIGDVCLVNLVIFWSMVLVLVSFYCD